MLGADTTLEQFYSFKLFESECVLKSSIEEFGSTLGAAGILNSLKGSCGQLKYVTVFTVTFFKEANLEMIKNDPCYDRFAAFFKHGDILTLPKVCNPWVENKDSIKHFDVVKISSIAPSFIQYSPATYNTSEELKNYNNILREVPEEEVLKMAKQHRVSECDLINTSEMKEEVITVEEYTISSYAKARQRVGLIENGKRLIFKYTRPQCFDMEQYTSGEKYDLIKLLLYVFDKWILKDTSRKNELTFEVAETKESFIPLIKIFKKYYELDHHRAIDSSLLERVIFNKL
ncbi:hypothetical protein ENBRE01_2452 [Enteropsectra breve]|nr:hypothetical protein ENBRE01_2452 [Enteropsectra breve]